MADRFGFGHLASISSYFHTVREFDNYMKDGSNGVNVYKVLIGEVQSI
jgi:hypothetical protein